MVAYEYRCPILLADRLLHALAVRAILPGGLHANIPTVILQQPLFENKDLLVECGKALLLVAGRDSLSCDDGGDEKRLVHIHAATDGINDFK